jgi:phosphate starvation-inducible membrane PsiE
LLAKENAMSRLHDAEVKLDSIEKQTEKIGHYLVDLFQYLALFVIGATIVWSGVTTYIGLIEKGAATIDDILLLFIFLELGAMVGIYFKTNRLPVQFLLYVAITVMTRSLASTLSVADMPDLRILSITGGTLILAICVWILRHASWKFPPFISHSEAEDSPRAQNG